MAHARTGSGGRAPFYLPDFCAPRSVLAVVLIAELVALLLTLARYGVSTGFWTDLARTSLFLLWVGLGSAAVLCAFRGRLQRLDVARGSALALLLTLAVTAAVTEAAWWVASSPARTLGLGPVRADHFGFLARNLFIGAVAGGVAPRHFFVSHQGKRHRGGEGPARIPPPQGRRPPHFLFNSMNTIASLTRSDPARAEDAIADLADLFRASLRESNERIPLAEEIEIARTYARIEQLRLGPRLDVQWRLADLPATARVPPLLLQPLVENAVYHGVEPLPEGGTVLVEGHLEGGQVVLSVENPVAPERAARAGGSRIGLDSVRQRLDLTFPGEASCEAGAADGRFRVTLRFPAERRA